MELVCPVSAHRLSNGMKETQSVGDGKSRGPCPWESDGVGRGLWKDKEGSTGAKHLESEGF